MPSTTPLGPPAAETGGALVPSKSLFPEEVGARQPSLGRVLAQAAGDAVNLVVMGAFALTALLAGSLWLLAFGIATYAFLVTWKATSQECWQRALGDETVRPRLPDPFHLADPLLRRWVSAMIVARSESTRLLREASPRLRQRLAELPRALDWLETWAAHTLARIEDLDRHLALLSRASLQEEEERLGRMARTSVDAVTRREYERARQVRLDHLEMIDELCHCRARMMSTLQRVVAAAEALPSQVMHLVLLETVEGGAPTPELELELDRLRRELEIAEESHQSVDALLPLRELSLAPRGSSS